MITKWATCCKAGGDIGWHEPDSYTAEPAWLTRCGTTQDGDNAYLTVDYCPWCGTKLEVAKWLNL